MYEKSKTSLWIVAVIAILFTIGLAVAAPAVIAQGPVLDEIEGQASLELTDFTGPAPAVNPASELIVVETVPEGSLNSADGALPGTSVEPGSELSLWEESHLPSPSLVEDVPPTRSVKPGSELSMWEWLNLLVPFLAD